MNIRAIKCNPLRELSFAISARRVLTTIVAGLVASVTAVAADYSQYTTEQLMEMRGQARDMSEQDRQQYREEMQSRVQNMSTEEWQQFRSNENNDRGQGTLTRERSRSNAESSGFGYGYEQRQSQGGRGSGGGGRR